MESIRLVRVATRVSLVVALRDGFTLGAPSDKTLEVRLEGYLRRPVAKADGTYIFNDLTSGTYRLHIDATYYFRETLEVSVGIGAQHVLLPVTLLPTPSYPYTNGDTLIRAMLVERTGSPVSGARVTATILSDDNAKGRLADDAAKGSDTIVAASLIGRLDQGDRLLLLGRGSKEGRESAVIAEVVEYQRKFKLEKPLDSSYPRGSMLLPVYRSRTTERGELAIAIPGGRAKTFMVELRIEPASGGPEAVDQFVAEEGGTVNIGSWIL
ncbi:MAG: hypothetical protein K0Q59_5886 [Paenibacillus sp.]|nr:hypothetical protein [Paenibacillus sp.]